MSAKTCYHKRKDCEVCSFGTYARPVPDPVTPLTAGMVCGFMFRPGVPCGVTEDHPVHYGAWTRAEPNHTFEAFERRQTPDRRAALVHPSDAAGEGGHRTDEPHDCFLMRCAALGRDVRFLTEQLAARATRDETALDVAVEAAKSMRVPVDDIKAALAALRGPVDRNEAIVMGCAQAVVWAMDARLSEPTDPA